MNKILLDKIQQRLTQKNVRYSTKDFVISFDMNIDETVGILKLQIHVLENSFVSYASLTNKATPDKFCDIAEYLHRANFGLALGNFEMDFTDGEIRYKYSVEVENPNNLSNQILDKCVLLPCFMFERYGNGILTILFGNGNPQKLIEEIENNQ